MMHPNRKDAITHEQARKSLQRFINLHFKNVGEKSRASIPAHQDDDDILLSDYISQQESVPELGSGALREALETINKLCEAISRIRWARGTDKLNDEINYAIQVQCKAEAALSLSSPIEPGRCPTCTSSVRNIKAGLAYGVLEPGKCPNIWHDEAQASSEIREALGKIVDEYDKYLAGPERLPTVGLIEAIAYGGELLTPSRQGAGGK